MRALLLVAAALLAAAAPAAAQTAQTAQQLYEEGVAARRAGDAARAVPLLEQAAAAEPGNADIHLQLGLALMDAGRLSEAEASLRRTLALAPDYADARDALRRLDGRRGEAAGYRWRLDLDGSYSALDGGRADWKEGAVRLRYQLDEDTAVAGGIEAARRFGRGDVYGELRVEQALAGGSSLWLALGGTPDADFRPEWQIAGGGAFRLRAGPSATLLTIEGRQAHYPVGDIQTLIPGVEQYFAGGRAWASLRWINVFDETGRHHMGWLARGDLLASDGLRLFAGAADAPDVSEGVVTDTFSLFGGLAIDLSDRTTLRLSLAHEDRAGGGDRVEAGLGIGLRF